MHGLGIAHRDIKLENMMFDEANMMVKFIDFGFGCSATLCETADQPYGTIEVFPPEFYAQRRSPSTLKEMQAADVWALGMVFMGSWYGFHGHVADRPIPQTL